MAGQWSPAFERSTIVVLIISGLLCCCCCVVEWMLIATSFFKRYMLMVYSFLNKFGLEFEDVGKIIGTLNVQPFCGTFTG